MKRLLYGVAVLAIAIAFTLAVPGSAWAPAKLTFKVPRALDRISINVRCLPFSTMDPGTEDVTVLLAKSTDLIHAEYFAPGQLVPNSRGNKWTFKIKRPEVPAAYNVKIIKKYRAKTGVTEYLFKFNAVIDAWAADPARNPGPTEEELGTIFTQISIGDDAFYVDALWECIPKNLERPVKGWKLADKYLQSL
jgi:hypothetical protein